MTTVPAQWLVPCPTGVAPNSGSMILTTSTRIKSALRAALSASDPILSKTNNPLPWLTTESAYALSATVEGLKFDLRHSTMRQSHVSLHVSHRGDAGVFLSIYGDLDELACIRPDDTDATSAAAAVARFASVFAAHLPAALEALHRVRMSQGDADTPRTIRLRAATIAAVLQKQWQDDQVQVHSATPWSPLCAQRGGSFRIGMDEPADLLDEPADLLDERAIKAWSMPPALDASLSEETQPAISLSLKPISAIATPRTDAIAALRAAKSLPAIE